MKICNNFKSHHCSDNLTDFLMEKKGPGGTYFCLNFKPLFLKLKKVVEISLSVAKQ